MAATLLAHAERQRAELEGQPALGIEPFAVADVYIQTECGVLPWHKIRDGIDPFSEKSAERQDLMDTVLGYMRRKTFNDCIVIQGAPGAGKSTFTKKLCGHLHEEGLIPIRIPLQHFRVDTELFDAVRDVVVRFSGPASASFRPELLSDKVFSGPVHFGEADISPYVFIFDGWDEISLSADEGFQQRVERLLDSIRQRLLSQNRNKVRVVLTGRPSQAVGKTNFLRDDTPVLTIRPIRPEHLERYVSELGSALKTPGFTGEEIDNWTLGDSERYAPILNKYKGTFPNTGTLEVLGQPLLAHLSMKVMASFDGDLSMLITPPTTLYRRLVDLTCKRGGKHPWEDDSTAKSGRIEGKDLRALLHGTALAITAHGSESIPMEELELRLETLGVGKEVFRVTRAHPLTNLMISFYFKGTQEQSGCEFLHKSFREYLAAEAIIEVVKEYSHLVTHDLAEKDKDLYWQDFPEGDPRWWLTRKLGEILSAQWLSREIMTHVSQLFEWEIERTNSSNSKHGIVREAGIATDPVTMRYWERVRDGLADVWDWWSEGVHLRLQPKAKQKTWQFDKPPYVVELVTLAMRRSNYNQRTPPRPVATVIIDGHLGYGLFQLTCFSHWYISAAKGWVSLAEALGPSQLWNDARSRPRRYQVSVEHKNTLFVQFAPSGESIEYFRSHIDRINGARVGLLSTSEVFPGGCDMRGLSLQRSYLSGVSFSKSDTS